MLKLKEQFFCSQREWKMEFMELKIKRGSKTFPTVTCIFMPEIAKFSFELSTRIPENKFILSSVFLSSSRRKNLKHIFVTFRFLTVTCDIFYFMVYSVFVPSFLFLFIVKILLLQY